MRAAETLVQMLRRHVQEGAVSVMRQRDLIERLHAGGLPTADAEALLVTFEELQRRHVDHLARVEGP